MSLDTTYQNQPISYDTAFSDTNAFAANTPHTVFTPAANTKGAIVYLAEYSLVASTYNEATLLTNSAAPTTRTDGRVLAVSRMTTINATSTGFYYQIQLQRAVYIPAGQGLYVICGGIISAGVTGTVLYSLL